jgi:hypothetical protein
VVEGGQEEAQGVQVSPLNHLSVAPCLVLQVIHRGVELRCDILADPVKVVVARLGFGRMKVKFSGLTQNLGQL